MMLLFGGGGQNLDFRGFSGFFGVFGGSGTDRQNYALRNFCPDPVSEGL